MIHCPQRLPEGDRMTLEGSDDASGWLGGEKARFFLPDLNIGKELMSCGYLSCLLQTLELSPSLNR
ncbi:hypothetical protein [Candidatus Nitrospira salsa]|nr:MAG: hypothetical protein NPIRA01_08990 [Nitrospirales bacterium]